MSLLKKGILFLILSIILIPIVNAGFFDFITGKVTDGALDDTLNIYFTADNLYELYVNGQFIGSTVGTVWDWADIENYVVNLRPGKNVVAVKATNHYSVSGIFGEFFYGDQRFITDTSWKVSSQEEADWKTVEFDDSSWENTVIQGNSGDYPWTQVRGFRDPVPDTYWIWDQDNRVSNAVRYFRYSFDYNVPQENLAPTVTIQQSQVNGTAPLTVYFTGRGYDTDGYITAYNWDLGDGQTSSYQTVTHVYEQPGTYNVVLTVTDNEGATGTTTALILVSSPIIPEDCRECKGKITELTIQYKRDNTATIKVEQKKEGVIYENIVSPNGQFTLVGADSKGTLGTEISFYVNDILNTKMHTSCSVPVGPGLLSGDFKVISGESKDGGTLCDVEEVTPVANCGDGFCNGAETCSSCATDCGECATPAPVGPYCGDESCNGNETCETCNTDCGDCVPETVQCTDSDGGLNYNTKGTTYGKDYEEVVKDHIDYCKTDAIRVQEFYCTTQPVPWSNNDETIVIGNLYTCPNGCQDGACISTTPEPNATGSCNGQPIACSSTTDCGTAGWQGESFCGTDGNVYRQNTIYSCVSPGTCDSNCLYQTNTNVYQNCEYGCENGQCIAPPVCTGGVEDGRCSSGCGASSTCDGKVPGSEYRCDSNGLPSDTGDSWCLCYSEFNCDGRVVEGDICSQGKWIRTKEPAYEACLSDCGADPNCNLRIADSQYTCDSTGAYSITGDNICTCTDSCELSIEVPTPTVVANQSYCGDGVCDSGEDCNSCSSDCGSCVSSGERKITNLATMQMDPVIHEDIIVWEDQRNGNTNTDIYMYDLSTDQETQVTSSSGDQFQPAVWGNKIVFEHQSSPGFWEVHLYDILTGQETTISNPGRLAPKPDIYENKVVWKELKTGVSDANIILYDIDTGQKRDITTNTQDQIDAQIYGDKIVWQDNINGDWDIYMYDLTTNQEEAIATGLENQMIPDIHSDKVVWIGKEGIYLYDISTKQERRILETGTSPKIHLNKVVFKTPKPVWDKNSGVSVYDIVTGEITVVVTDTAYDPYPSIFENKVVWQDARDGFTNVYLYELDTTVQELVNQTETVTTQPITTTEQTTVTSSGLISSINPTYQEQTTVTLEIQQEPALPDQTQNGTVTTTQLPQTEDVPTTVCAGCFVENQCLSIGVRTLVNNQAVYCDSDRDLKLMKEGKDSCKEGYECKSSTCKKKKCLSIDKIKNKNVLQGILDFFKGIFS